MIVARALGCKAVVGRIPKFPALPSGGNCLAENVLSSQKWMQHNMGLCCIKTGIEGGRGKFSGRYGVAGAKASGAEKFCKKQGKAFPVWM
jgi:hypothetical protein